MQKSQFEFIKDLAGTIRTAILQHLHDKEIGQNTGITHSGAQTFGIDIIAEDALFLALKNFERRVRLFLLV